MAKTDLTAQRLRELLHYDPETGIFTRIAKPIPKANRMPLGPVPGSPSGHGYMRIGVDGSRYYAHRLACLFMTGQWPKDDMDHIDHDRSNNKWANLRLATRSENMQNLVIGVKNTSGVKGVSWNAKRGQWHARFKHMHKMIHIGYFSDIREAESVYLEKVAVYRTHLPPSQQPK